MRKSSTNRRREICITFAMKSWTNRVASWKSRRHDRKRSWPIPGLRFIRTTSATADLIGKAGMASARSRENSDRCRRSDRSRIRHRRAEGHAGARQTRFRNRSAPQVADDRCSHARWPNQLSGGSGIARTRSIRSAQESGARCSRRKVLLSKTEPHENNVGFSDRSDVPIEPRMSEQWFLRYPKTKEALAVVRDHLIRFFPAHWEKVYAQWLENIQDWCISRQVWWGHRIPAWYRNGDEVRVQIESPGDGWTQDPDTLDTWFSSWLWAYETMDEETRKKFYPTSVLVTAPDIIFFWVARMIIAGLRVQAGQIGQDRRQHSVSRCLFHRTHSRQQRSQDVEVVRQFARSARLDREIWRGRFALRFDADCADRAGHSFR